MKLLCYLGFVLVFTASPVAANEAIEFSGLHRILDPHLKEQLILYYQNENQRLWNRTFDTRPRNFQQLVPYEKYRHKMRRDAAGFKIVRIEVLSIEADAAGRTQEEFHIWMKFDELVETEEALERLGSMGVGKVGDIYWTRNRTTWLRESGIWKCAECGVRDHIYLNARFAW